MNEPADYRIISEYLSIGSDTNPTISVTIPNSIVIASGATWSQEFTANVPGEFTGKAIRSNVMHSKNGNYYYGTFHYSVDNAVSPSFASYYILISVYRKSSTEVALKVSISNQMFPAGNLTTSANGGTITAEIRTLVIS